MNARDIREIGLWTIAKFEMTDNEGARNTCNSPCQFQNQDLTVGHFTSPKKYAHYLNGGWEGKGFPIRLA